MNVLHSLAVVMSLLSRFCRSYMLPCIHSVVGGFLGFSGWGLLEGKPQWASCTCVLVGMRSSFSCMYRGMELLGTGVGVHLASVSSPVPF